MERSTNAGFREIEHTADWELQVWAPDLPGLFVQAALGMASLAGASLEDEPRLNRSLALSAPDPESLLVAFLSEILYFAESEGTGFDRINVKIRGSDLGAELSGAPLAERSKEIKAVTYHKLAIRKTAQGVEANIIFDV